MKPIGRVLFFCLLLAAVTAQASEPRAITQNERNAVIGFNSVLLGGFIAGQWVSAADLQGESKYNLFRIMGGEEYKVFSSKGFEGTGIGSAIHSEHPGKFASESEEPPTQVFDLTIDNGQTLGFGAEMLAVRCDWELTPRVAAVLDTNNATYKKVLKEYLARNGLPDAEAHIMQLYRVDLEGDGVDEVVIVARNIVGEGAREVTWEADKALDLEYSLVLLRKIVNGAVRELPLAQFINLKDNSTNPVVHTVHEFADLNGDGSLEIIISADSYTGSSYSVFEVKGGKAIEALVNGWE